MSKGGREGGRYRGGRKDCCQRRFDRKSIPNANQIVYQTGLEIVLYTMYTCLLWELIRGSGRKYNRRV